MAPVCDEAGEGAAFDAVGDVIDGFADDVVAAADREGLFTSGSQSIEPLFGLGERRGTIP